MATQGNIAIWNYTKLISKFPEADTNPAIKKIIGGFVYDNPFKKEEKILISYEGDNLNFPNGFYPDYSPEEWLQNFSSINLAKAEKQRAENILEYLLNECCRQIFRSGIKLHFALGIVVEILFSALDLWVEKKDCNGKPDPLRSLGNAQIKIFFPFKTNIMLFLNCFAAEKWF